MERRRQPRLPFSVDVEIHLSETESEPVIAGTSRDICTTGLLVSDVDQLPLDTVCEVAISLSSGELAMPIRARGRVVRQVCDLGSGEHGVAIQFLEMDDESQELLWNVIRYNSGPDESAL